MSFENGGKFENDIYALCQVGRCIHDENFNRMTRSHDSLGMNATRSSSYPANVPLSGDRKDLNEIDSRIRTEPSVSMRMHSIVFVFVLGTRAKWMQVRSLVFLGLWHS